MYLFHGLTALEAFWTNLIHTSNLLTFSRKENCDYFVFASFLYLNSFVKKLLKLTEECVFSVNNRLIKQIDGCLMGGPISVVFSDIYVSKVEEDIITAKKPHFYKRYVDDTYIRRKKNKPDSLFEKLNSYYPNIKLTIEKNPAKFLDTEIIRRGCEIKNKSLQ